MKLDINRELVRQLIVTQFPQWSKLEVRPVELSGWDNRTFHLGESMLVRLPSAEGYAQQAEKEQRWLPILANKLPLSIPALLAKGYSDNIYPWKWGIYRWIEGETANVNLISNLLEFARSLAQFLHCLQLINTNGAPVAGQHSFYRGTSLLRYDQETRTSIDELKEEIDTHLAIRIWEDAISSEWERRPVWFHGDVASGNLIIKDGKLSAIIDFGCCGVGDPSCDLAIAWTFLIGESRKEFRAGLNIDDGTWSRGRGWALWKVLIAIQALKRVSNNAKGQNARNTLNEIFNEYIEDSIVTH